MAVAFFPLTVSSLEPEGADAVAITFSVPDSLQSEFSFDAGEHVTLRADLDGVDVRRSYSIAASPGSGTLRIGVKRVPEGAFSTFLTERVVVGTSLDVMPPVGEFTLVPKPGAGRNYGFFAAGSGITPIVSMLAAALEADAGARCTLFYGNRTSADVMFLESLEALKDRHLSRLQIVHVLSREASDLELFSGRITKQRAAELCNAFLPIGTVDEWYLCGPGEMVRAACEMLSDAGVEDSQVHTELFFKGDEPLEADLETVEGLSEVAFSLGGRTTLVQVDPQGAAILDRALTVRTELPFACKGGVCATCKALVISGEVTMDRNYALTQDEVESGFILTCQAHPVSQEVEITYDVHGGLGR
jgi:ring-1,2-phenylacetyl-CoA epoxidase subunit PaaE